MVCFVYDVVLYDLLNDVYKDIVHDMLLEDFFIVQDKWYDVVVLIDFCDKVVGFLACNLCEGFVVCELCFIQSSFRGRGLFCDALNSVNELFDIGVCLYLPNSFTMDSLLLNGYAIKLNEGLVLCDFPLTFHTKNYDKLYFSNLYDYSVCGVVDLEHELVSPLMDVDKFRFNVNRVIDKRYFSKLRSDILC